MASLKEAVFEFSGNATKLIQSLREVEKKIKDVPAHKVTRFDVETAKALADVEKLEAQIQALTEHEPDITPHLNMRKLIADLAVARGAIESIPNKKEIELKLKGIDKRRDVLSKKLEDWDTEIKRLQASNPQVVVDGNITKLQAKLDIVKKELIALKTKQSTPEIDLKITKAEEKAKRLKEEIHRLSEEHPVVTVDAEIRDLVGNVEAARAELASLHDKRVKVRMDLDRSGLRGFSRAEQIIGRVTGQVEKAGKSAEKAVTPTFNLSGAFGKMSGVLRRLGPLTTGLGIAMIAGLLPALVAVTAAIGGAVTAAAALATGLAGALAPAVALLIPLFGRLAAVIKAYQARQLAFKNAGKDARTQAQAQARSEEQVANAKNAVRDADEGVATAERNLTDARKAAADQLRQARRDNADAINAEKDAAAALAKAEVEAYAEIKKSIEDVKDAQLALAQAQLDQKQARIDTKEAQLNLKKLREQMGLTGKTLDATFKKFEGAHFDLSGLKGALKGAGADLGGDPAENLLKLQQALLDVQKAQLGEKQAADSTKHAHQDLNDKIKTATKLQRDGISAVDGYRTAQKNLADAVQNRADTQRNLNQLVKQGISGNPQVIAAQEGLRNSIQNQATALGNLHDAQKQHRKDIQGASRDWNTYKDAVKNLSPTEKKLLTVFEGVHDIFKGMGGATDAVLSGLVDGILAVLPFVDKLGGGFKTLGTIWGNLIRDFAKKFTLPTNLLKFKDIFKGTLSLSQSLGTAVSNIFQTLVNVAAAIMPQLIAIGTEFQSWTGSLQNSTADTQKLGNTLKPMVTAFKLIIGIGKELAGVIVDIFKGGSGPINSFLGWIKDGLKGFRNFLQSAKGKNKISQFFKDTLPFVKSFIGFLVRIGKTIVIALQIALPILKPVLDTFNSLLDVFNFLLGVLNTVLGPFKTLIGVILSFFVPMGRLGTAFGKIGKAIEHAGGFWKAFVKLIKGAGERIFNTLIKPIIDGWNTTRAFFARLPGRFASIVTKILNAVDRAGKFVFKIVTAPYRLAWDEVVKIFNKIKKPLADAALKVWNGIKSVFKGVKGFFRSVFGDIANIGKNMLNGVIGVINAAIKGINKITPGKIKLPGPIPDIPGIPDIPTIPKLASGGVTRGATVATIGERGREAIIPLSRSVLREIGESIASAMDSSVKHRKVAAAGVGTIQTGPHQLFEKVEVNMTSPGGQPQDPRAAAVMFSRELRRRGG